jgi:hypothetical protein
VFVAIEIPRPDGPLQAGTTEMENGDCLVFWSKTVGAFLPCGALQPQGMQALSRVSKEEGCFSYSCLDTATQRSVKSSDQLS